MVRKISFNLDNCETSCSEFYCVECKENLCKTCLDSLHSVGKKKKHLETLIKSEEKVIYECMDHKISQDLFCEDCFQLLCYKCVLDEFGGKHFQHKRKKKEEVTKEYLMDTYKRAYEGFEKKESFLKTEIKENNKKIEELTKKIQALTLENSKHEQILKDINSFTETLNNFPDNILVVIQKFHDMKKMNPKVVISKNELYTSTWGTVYPKVYFYDVCYDSPKLGTLEEHTEIATKFKLKVPPTSHPGSGGIYSSLYEKSYEKVHQDAQKLHQYLSSKYDFPIYSNLLLLHGNSPSCYAHDAETGSFYAFGGPSGNGYSFCRGGNTVSKILHVYLLVE